jgi:uncharacterized protein YicC (UPF0701 family)
MKFRIFFPTELKGEIGKHLEKVERRFSGIDIKICKWLYKKIGKNPEELLNFKWKFLSDSEIEGELITSAMKREKIAETLDRMCEQLKKKYKTEGIGWYEI